MVGDTLVDTTGTLPGLMESLVAAEWCLLQTMPVQGGFAIEVFAGTMVFTLGLLFACVPCLRPWDAQFGDQFDVITNGQFLIELVKAGDITAAHLATPCQSQTWARVPALRDWANIDGFPHLSAGQAMLVSSGNALAAFTGTFCQALYQGNGYFSIENPWRSWLWASADILSLYALPGVSRYY